MIENKARRNVDEIYVCSKPLQLLNILNIVQSDFTETICRVLCVIEIFSVNQFVRERVLAHYGCLFKEIIFLSSYEDILLLNKKYNIDKLYIDSDFGTNKHLIKSVNANWNIVYEEGYGTYRHLYIEDLFLRIKYKLKRLSTFIGGCTLTNQVILYRPEVYKLSHKNKVNSDLVKFTMTFYETLLANWKPFIDIFQYIPSTISSAHNVLLIAGTNSHSDFDVKMLKLIQSYSFDYVILKAHPHLNNNVTYDIGLTVNLTIESPIPIEFVIYDLYTKGMKVILLHSSSSAAIYMSDCIFKSIDIISQQNSFKKEYDELYPLLTKTMDSYK